LSQLLVAFLKIRFSSRAQRLLVRKCILGPLIEYSVLLVDRLKTLIEEALVKCLVEVLLVFVHRQLTCRFPFLAHFQTVILNVLLVLSVVLPS